MKLTIAFLVVALITAAACGRSTLGSLADVREHVGEKMTVESVVSGVYTAPSSNVTFIDMGGSYPDNLFAGVIFASDASEVGDVSGLTGKTVELTGTIQLYKGRPEIVLKSADQIKVH
jgi:hypothetical protein